MTVRTHTQKDGTIWEWEETAELAAYIKQQQSRYGSINQREQNSPSQS